MKKMHLPSRLLSLLLVVALLSSFAVPIGATGSDTSVNFKQVDNGAVSESLLQEISEQESNEPDYADTDVVRVSIVLEQESTLEAGFSTMDIAENASAMSYRENLQNEQAKLTDSIEKAIGEKLDVAWNLTLAANIISANVEYGQIAKIEALSGVQEVVLETKYEPQTADAAEPNMAVSTQMTGTNLAWQSGYTGAGMRVAIIDTGLDWDHQSMDPDALAVALAEDAGYDDMEYEDYLAAIDVMDEAEVAEKLSQLHVAERSPEVTAADLYLNLKTPFAYNYIDEDLDVTHDNDGASEHGSHVAGISVANRLVKSGDDYVSAVDTVGVVGNAPDAQIIVMKVFGKAGGAYDSDYMAAIEDAIILGCDSVNLSLGSAAAGMTTNSTYQDILDGLVNTDTVVVMSAGNEGYWAEMASPIGYPYLEAANYHTGGSPGSYTNSFTVASVDNDGGVGSAFKVAGRSFVYSETQYTNKPLTTLDTSADGSGTDLDYVFIDGVGQPSDFEGIDVTGKVVFCSRGTTSFFEKAEAAVAAGAIATIIYNNEPGVINLDLSDYTKTEPCISITQDAGKYIRENSVDAGGYFTGKITVSKKTAIVHNDSETLTISEFSSWGIPGDLSMKPEIIAPGGSIYSLNGAVSATDQYELMSGTSMAAPQVSGIAALVKQYIEENELSQPGITDRALAQSLMMSTATPLKDANGNYYPILQQGAGLANTAAATSADSYITVDGMPDGKVKAELGDDPNRTGEYSFSFNIHNISNEGKVYALSASLFTQDAFRSYANANMSQDETALFMDTLATPLDAKVTWSSDGQIVNSAGEMSNCDFDGNGTVNADDAQALLDYVSGARDTINAIEFADVDNDGDVDSYDAHLFLNKLGKDTVTVPAGESVNITVTMKLTEEEKAYLNEYYTGGAYVQAFVFAEALTNAEGVTGTSHSIPMLAYYGNWTDMSMFDIGTAQEFATGQDVRTPYMANTETNTFAITYANDTANKYVFGGNPLVPDEVYMPERNAINSVNGDKISGASFVAIRNAAASRFRVTNVATGQTLAEAFPGAVTAAYYYSNGGRWMNTGYNLNTNWAPEGLAEGDQIEVALSLAPEYYLQADGSVNWDAMGDGATLSTVATVDNTAPVLEDVSLSLTGNTLTVTASDNRYVAAAVLYNAGGTGVLAYAGAKADAQPGQSYEYTMSMDGVSGKKFLLQVADYAMNVATYEVELQLGEEQPLPERIAFDVELGAWVGFNRESDHPLEAWSSASEIYLAATIVDHIAFIANEDGFLYVAPEDELSDLTPVCQMDIIPTDMAYNPADGMIYAVADGVLYTVDKLTGATQEIGAIGVSTNTLACDAEGTFYCNKYGSGEVYSFTLDTIADPELLVKTNLSTSAYVQAMEIDPNTGLLCWNSYYAMSFLGFVFGYSYYYEIDTQAGTYTRYNDLYDELTCLIIPEKTSGGGWTEPTTEVSGMQLSAGSLRILRGGSAKLTANVQPWTATDRSVTWTSADPSIATVDADGNVKALEKGETTITATSNLDPTVSASCTVIVETVEVTLEGAVQDADGNPMLFTWDLENDSTWTGGTALDTSIMSVTKDPLNNVLYVNDAATNTWAMHKVDPATGESVETAGNSTGVPLWDMEYSSYFSTAEAPMVSSVYGYYFLSPKDPMNLDSMAFDLSGRVNYLTAITSLGYEEYWDEDDQVMLDTEHVLLMDESGTIWHFWIYETDQGMSAWLASYPSNLPELGLTFEGYNNMEAMYCSLIVGEDGNLYLSYFTGDTNQIYQLVFNEEAETYEAALLGDMGNGVWPAALISASSNTPAEGGNQALIPADAVKLDAEPVTTEELQAAAAGAAVTMNAVSPADNAQKDQMDISEADVPAGSLQAVQVGDIRKTDVNRLPLELKGVETGTECQGKTVTLSIVADNDTTNGVYTVAYDASKVTFTGKSGLVDYTSFSDRDGVVTFAYAAKDAVPAGTTLATLTFTAEADTEATFTITTVEEGRNKPGTSETLTVTVPEHDYIVSVVPATCTEGGYTLYTCRNCGSNYKDHFTEALGHDWSAWTVQTPASCEIDGVEARTCARCGETETRPIPATGHNYDITVVDPTCTESGYTLYTCTVCGYSYRDEVVEATGHSWGEWTVTKEATCEEAGEETRTCANCGETETRALEATGHNWGEWTVTKEATCEEAGEETRTCANCGETETRALEATGHNWGEWTVTKEATCEVAGEETRTCANCGQTETRPIPATGHTYVETVVAPTCTEEGYTLHTCEVCGSNYKTDVVEALGHDWSEWTVTEAADCFHAGSETRTCARCEASEIRTIAANSDNCPSKAFKDVDINRWYHKGIDFVVTQGLMEGVGDGLFLPNGNLTRGQMVTILYRLAGQPEISGKSPFTDVQEGRFYADAVVWAAENGIVKGVTEELFVPNRFVTREEMVTMLARYAELNGVEITTEGSLSAYPDADQVSNYAVAYMTWAVENGILNGAEGMLIPRKTATRAQAAAVLLRYCEAFGE